MKNDLINSLYVIHKGLYQIRLKGTQEVISAVGSFSDLLSVSNLLLKKDKTIDNLKEKLSECEYAMNVPAQELVRRKYEETNAVEKDLYKNWYNTLTRSDTCERDVKVRKRVKIKF